MVCTIGTGGCPYAVAMAFGGFPADAFGFYERLEADNSRRFWDAHKTEYQRYVREPMAALRGTPARGGSCITRHDGRMNIGRLPLFCDTALAERIERAEVGLIAAAGEARRPAPASA